MEDNGFYGMIYICLLKRNPTEHMNELVYFLRSSKTVPSDKFHVLLTSRLEFDVKRRFPTCQLGNCQCIDRMVLIVSILRHKDHTGSS